MKAITFVTFIAFAVMWIAFAQITNNAAFCYFVALLHFAYALTATGVYKWIDRKMRSSR